MREFQARAQSAEAISLLKRAIEVDQKFAMAYATLGRVHADFGETEVAAENVARPTSCGMVSATARTFTSLSPTTGS
jgi:lipopolysaccharide biosynthesis regulator YciM